ncbi:nucleotide exchange factor GrpE [uncultured Propionibacterium sp.]|uniref:nucleotide exchange factor GrpE n=1 Tax=uncultured Propionibacterium sp. TaxID=218066 RepID=UPI00292F984E|nr:nucleotide exchange factor GrpE [uncultured Propionibacterium sp.]
MSEQPTPDEVVAQAEAVAESTASALAEGETAGAPEARRGREDDETPGQEPDWKTVAAERTADLQRLQAEYVNYKKRVDRDRALARQLGVEAVVADLMPVLDAIQLAKSHGDLDGGFKMVADELEKVAAKHGLVVFGTVGDPFDPTHHEALMEVPLEEKVTVTTLSQVIQPGYQLRDRVIRPARVAVANPRQD